MSTDPTSADPRSTDHRSTGSGGEDHRGPGDDGVHTGAPGADSGAGQRGGVNPLDPRGRAGAPDQDAPDPQGRAIPPAHDGPQSTDPDPGDTPGLEPGGGVAPGDTPPIESGTSGLGVPETKGPSRAANLAIPLGILLVIVLGGLALLLGRLLGG